VRLCFLCRLFLLWELSITALSLSLSLSLSVHCLILLCELMREKERKVEAVSLCPRAVRALSSLSLSSFSLASLPMDIDRSHVESRVFGSPLTKREDRSEKGKFCLSFFVSRFFVRAAYAYGPPTPLAGRLRVALAASQSDGRASIASSN